MSKLLPGSILSRTFFQGSYSFKKGPLSAIMLPVVFLLISLLLFYFLAYWIIQRNHDAIDTSCFSFFTSITSPLYTRIAITVTFFGTGSFLIPCYILIVFYLGTKKLVKYARIVSTMAVSGLLLGWLLKIMFHRSRPPYPIVKGAGGYSFPSGHALGGFIFSGILLYLVWQMKNIGYFKWILFMPIVTFGIMIGLSRIYLHVHYATDVIGSLLLAFICFSATNIFFQFIYKEEKQKRVFLYDSMLQ